MDDAAPVFHRAGPVALWRQLADHLATRIASGIDKPMARLPTEPELCATYGISRITVRQAIRHLVEHNLVTRHQGKGTFVASPVMKHDLLELKGIIPTIQEQGLPLTTKLLDLRLIEPDKAARERLHTDEPRLLLLRRLYLSHGVPFGMTEITLPAIAADLTWAQVEAHSCYEILGMLLGIPVARADVTIGAQAANRSLANHLDIPPGTPLLLFERVSLCAAQIPREYTRFWTRADRYRFTMTIDDTVRKGGYFTHIG
ncbi:MAG: GntR family transcriptional regulator [Azospirillaceae bacterium]|nr:GntR family transcriptional regulator [Azospirillaceae bacterium]